MKRYFSILFVCLLGICFQGYAQSESTLKLDSCQRWARENYPLIKQFELIAKSKQYSINNANSWFYPQIAISGQASYQNEAVSVNSSKLPDIPFNFSHAVRKDQYQLVASVEQMIYQGTNPIKTQKRIAEVTAEIDTHKIEALLHGIRNQINQLYLGVLLIDKQIEQLRLTMNVLQANYHDVVALRDNGMVNSADVDILQAEIIQMGQQEESMLSTRRTYLTMLGYFIKKTINENVVLEIPQIDKELLFNKENHRPELSLYDAQINVLELQKKNVDLQNSPRLSIFARGGAGAPGYDFLNNDLRPMGIVGLKLQWNLTGFMIMKDSKRILDVQKSQVAIQKEAFEFENSIEMQKIQEEVRKLEGLLKSGSQITRLRENIRKAADAKLKEGIMSSIDYIKIVNDERLAKQNQSLHEIQLVMAIYNFKYQTNQ